MLYSFSVTKLVPDELRPCLSLGSLAGGGGVDRPPASGQIKGRLHGQSRRTVDLYACINNDMAVLNNYLLSISLWSI